MPSKDFQQNHYDTLIETQRPTRYGLSCGYHDRFDPALLETRPLLRRALERLFDSLFPTPIGTLLDIGCGTAYYWPLLAERCDTLVGLDISHRMVAQGQSYHSQDTNICQKNTQLICCHVDHIPISKEVADAVLVIDALHHLSHLTKVLKEVQRVLRVGGQLIAIEPNIVNPIVFTAHAIPPEERRALWPNHPWMVLKNLQQMFHDVSVTPVTYVSGVQNAKALHFVELLEPIFQYPPFSYFALRKVYRARKNR